MVSFIPHREQRQARYFVEHLPSEIGLDMIRVPGGQFLMGSPEDELERKDTEGPQHEVAISTFFMGRYPITQAQWKAVAGLSQINSKLDPDPASFKSDNHPVENVSWNDSVEFCARLSTHTNREYRLPTEAEWEYACRAGTDTPFYFGETITTDLANYQGIGDKSLGWSGAYGQGPEGEYLGKTTPVDYFGVANAFGLCDMHGNIAEWCQDHWHKDYTEAPTDGTAWQMTNSQAVDRVLRGGSWISYPELCRSASRNHSMPNLRNHSFGLRVVCNAPRALQ